MRILLAILLTSIAVRAAAAETLADLRHAWAAVYYQAPANRKVAQFAALKVRADTLVAQHPQAAEALILQAIVLSTYAEAKGSLDALGLVEAARDAALRAAGIDDRAADAGAYTVLGVLYYKVPGWPIGFGSNRKARAYLERALAIAPDAIDTNYFMADFLLEEGDRADRARAKAFLDKALAAPPRPGRDDEDAGRRRDIARDLARVSG